MTGTNPSGFIDTLRDASVALPSGYRDGFVRLAKLIQARRGKFQLLILDCRDERVRDRIIHGLDAVLDAARFHSIHLPLNQDVPDFAAVERDLVEGAKANTVIHVTGGPAWFDAARWDSFNIRRDAIAHQVKASLLFWLDPNSIAALAKIAIDLWAWRGAVIAFDEAPESAFTEVRKPDFRAFDDRALSERMKRIAFLRQTLGEPDLPDDIRFGLAIELGDLLASIGRMDEADTAYRHALSVAQDEHSRAVTMGKIADILQARGERDEALRIRREEELPVFDRLGNVRSRAVTMGKIADILQARGEFDEALRIRREEQLPVFDRLGDVRSRAVTMGQIADILQARGERDEALRIRREEELPVYDRLGDVRSRAVTMGKIADILQARGERDEALRIRREEELPVYDRLGDARERAVTMSKIADILQARGELDEALRIHREEQLPVYDRLGDARERAITMGKIADILQARGELDEALRIRREEELPVYDRLGDVRSRAVTLYRVAMALIGGGGLEDGRRQEIVGALREAFEIAQRLRIPDGIGHVGTDFAAVLGRVGQKQEAVRIIKEAEKAFAMLGDAKGLERVGQIHLALEQNDTD